MTGALSRLGMHAGIVAAAWVGLAAGIGRKKSHSTQWTIAVSAAGLAAIASVVAVVRSKSSIREALLEKLEPETRSSVVTIERLLVKLQKSLTDSHVPKYPLLLNFATAARAQAHCADRSFDDFKPIDDALLIRDAMRWMKFASSAYGAAICKALGLAQGVGVSHVVGVFHEEGMANDDKADVPQLVEAADKACILDHAGVREVGDIVVWSNTLCNDVNAPCFFLALDHESKSVVVAIRGTSSVADALTDLVCASVPFLKCQAHSGIARGAGFIFEKIRGILRQLLQEWGPKGYKLTLTGHSLGAGTAILLTMLIYDEGTLAGSAELPPLQCWAFAPPPVIFPLDAVPVECNKAIHAFAYCDDCVPRLCLRSVWHAILRAKANDAMGWSLAERIEVAVGMKTMKWHDAITVEATLRKAADEHPCPPSPLAIPGSIVWMTGKSGFHTTAEKFSTVLLTATMLSDHLPPQYEGGLQAMLDSLLSSKTESDRS
eukprot:TRINITY_DN49349_c0_g1_i1.p1 TRINITY_DN49349_c0_g1~~TRINITY_DN49349_c0_g1_i1.p1  ORF type:complete len:502 (+),score=57.99 TRINITY_DN49349_c0_g1_i1:37-1506(+)